MIDLSPSGLLQYAPWPRLDNSRMISSSDLNHPAANHLQISLGATVLIGMAVWHHCFLKTGVPSGGEKMWHSFARNEI